MNYFTVFYISHIDTGNPARCDSPSQNDIESCTNFGDPLCVAFADIIEENGRNCFKTCGVMCSKK